jgi:hypothetical protein
MMTTSVQNTQFTSDVNNDDMIFKVNYESLIQVTNWMVYYNNNKNLEK